MPTRDFFCPNCKNTVPLGDGNGIYECSNCHKKWEVTMSTVTTAIASVTEVTENAAALDD